MRIQAQLVGQLPRVDGCSAPSPRWKFPRRRARGCGGAGVQTAPIAWHAGCCFSADSAHPLSGPTVVPGDHGWAGCTAGPALRLGRSTSTARRPSLVRSPLPCPASRSTYRCLALPPIPRRQESPAAATTRPGRPGAPGALPRPRGAGPARPESARAAEGGASPPTPTAARRPPAAIRFAARGIHGSEPPQNDHSWFFNKIVFKTFSYCKYYYLKLQNVMKHYDTL
jgi:hypothetical protein